MRLLKPSPGECADRLTILELKMKYGSGGEEPSTDVEVNDDRTMARKVVHNASSVNIEPFRDEHRLIGEYLENNWIPDLDVQKGPTARARLDALVEELAELNHQVWKLTDQAHILKDAPDRMAAQANERAAEVLYLTIELNDKRAKLVRDINELFDIRHVEKIFA